MKSIRTRFGHEGKLSTLPTTVTGGCNQHGMGEGILGQDGCEWTSITNLFSGGRRKFNDVVIPISSFERTKFRNSFFSSGYEKGNRNS